MIDRVSGRASVDPDAERELAELRPGQVYEVTGTRGDDWTVTDESGEDYVYPPAWFELVPVVWDGSA